MRAETGTARSHPPGVEYVTMPSLRNVAVDASHQRIAVATAEEAEVVDCPVALVDACL
jgi:hypothetical protein